MGERKEGQKRPSIDRIHPFSFLNLDLDFQKTQKPKQVRALAVLPDGSLVSGSRDRTIVVWKKGKKEGERENNDRALIASATLLGHCDFVTSLCSLPPSSTSSSSTSAPSPSQLLLSGGRDAVGILWDVAAAEPVAKLGPGAHKWGVSSVAARPAAVEEAGSSSSSSSAAALFTASLDGTIAEWDLPSSSAGSLPPTAPSRVLRGHEGPVQACLVLPRSRALVSASSDRSVCVWLPSAPSSSPAAAPESDDCDASAPLPSVSPSAVLKDAHDDTVRGLALLPSGEGGEEGKVLLVTVGHDSLVKLWTLPPALLSPSSPPSSSTASALTPTLAATLVGHTALVYAAAAASSATGATTDGEGDGRSPLLATASEDATARVWSGSRCVSVLKHPGCVWACAWLGDGDLATACADGVVRLWTRRGSGREAPEEEREALAAVLAARDEKAAAAGAGAGAAGGGSQALPAGLKLSDPSILNQPGRPGQNAVVRDPSTGNAAVFEFDGIKNEWTKLGDVVGGADGGDTVAGGSSKWHLGKQWDHVFDVDVADGAPPLKLPYNDGENPYAAADRFLEAEQLPQSYRQQIVEHIIACTGGAAAAAADVSVNVDPFTGGGAYVPGTAMTPGGGFAAGAAGAGASSGSGGVTGGGADPFTGTAAAAASASAAAAAAAAAAPAAAAPRAYVLFDAPPRTEAVAAKARELASSAAETPPLLSALDNVDVLVAAAVASSSSSSSSPIPSASLALLDRMLNTWPASALFPVLDIARLVALSEQGSAALAAASASAPSSTDGESRGLSLFRALAAALGPDSPAPAKVTAARLVANAARHPELRALVTSRAAELAGLLAPVAAAAVGATGAAATAAASSAAALHNLCLSVAASSSSAPAVEASRALLSAVAGVLRAGPALGDDVGAFVAGGAAALAASSRANAAVAVDLGLREVVAPLLLEESSAASSPPRPKLSEAARELAQLLAPASSS